MIRKLSLFALVLAACDDKAKPCPPEKECPPPAAPVAPSGDWDAAAAADQKALVEAMFKALDNGNAEWFAKNMDEDAVLFETGAEGKPLARRGKKATEHVAKMLTEMKDGGMTLATTVGRTDCHSTGTVGFCAVEYKQVVTTAGKAGEPTDQFGTTVVHKVGADWKISHWHGGPGTESREMPGDGEGGGKAPGGKAPGGDGDGGKAGKGGKKAP